MDTNPMVQGTDTLTDCLNGTLITMNGNEVILQNDMGNRRVDNAFLPPGYQPVGMKEYGGVIYVAAYNPITNKSQIGSFPSPERKINNLDDPELGRNFKLSSFFDNSNIELDSYLGINVLKSDTFMVPLTGETSLRAGDKFSIYSPSYLYGNGIINDITNYNNTTTSKVSFDNEEIDPLKAYSPKNRKYTLAIGILNSQNEFVDITKTLYRWEQINNEWKPKIYDQDISEIYKFNDEYFISGGFNIPSFTETINDLKLIHERQQIAANTYAYKLIGPMYLKATLNHIENFNYNIYGLKESENNYTLWVEGYLTYNCPDGYSESGTPKNSNEDYYTFEEGKPTFSGFNFIGESSTEDDNWTIIKEESTYNTSTNLYSTKIVKKYNINTSTAQYEYIIGVLADKDNSGTYLKGLSVKGVIDLGLLGSGDIEITGWKFYNNFDKRTTTLTFSISAYPKYGEELQSLTINFYKYNNGEYSSSPIVSYSGLPFYNGRQTYVIDWDKGFEPRKLYKVVFQYKTSERENTIQESTFRWFLTTELFNEFYSNTAIPDFCSCSDSNFKNKMKVSLGVNSKIINNSIQDTKFYGGMISKVSNEIEYKCIHTIQLNLVSRHSYYIDNENLYPDFITINSNSSPRLNSAEIVSIGDETGNDDATFIKAVTIFKTTDGPNISELFSKDISIEDDTVLGTIIYKDKFLSNENIEITDIENGFDSFYNVVNDMLPSQYGGIIMNYDVKEGGDPDKHFIDIIRKQSTWYKNGLPANSDLDEGQLHIITKEKDGRYNYEFSVNSDTIFKALNSSVQNPSQMFQFFFQGAYEDGNPRLQYFSKNTPSDSNTTYDSSREDKDAYYSTRLWWRTSNGEWATFDELFDLKYDSQQNPNPHTQSNINSELSNMVKRYCENYTYCIYNTYSNNNGIGLYMHGDKYSYTNPYSVPLILKVLYTKGSQSNNISLVPAIGNLEFLENTNLITNEDNTFIFDLKSSKTFQDTINTFDPYQISNIDINSGLQVDSLNRKLSPNYLYIPVISGGEVTKLIRQDNQYFSVDSINTINGKNTLTYNRYWYTSPKYRYQRTSKDQYSDTVLDYNVVNVIPSISLTQDGGNSGGSNILPPTPHEQL